MNYIQFQEWIMNRADEDIFEVVEEICEETGHIELYDHMEHVANLASEIASHYNMSSEDAYLAGFLHDVGRLVKSNEYILLLNQREIHITEQERKVPSVLHGKVSAIIANHEFHIKDENLLNALRYHVSLRKDSSDMEKVIFLADKMSWDNKAVVNLVEDHVFQSLNIACFKVLEWLKEDIEGEAGIVLENLEAAYQQLKNNILV